MPNRSLAANLVLLAIVGVGIIVCIWFIAQSQRTTTEQVLFSIFLTALSSIGSWAVSAYYAEYSSSRNLKFFALKAAEKVTNLSKELDRLSAFLQQEIESDYESPNEAVLAKDDRIEGAIHIINTLKSVNDGSLSDWQGVIGEEIVARREQQRENEAYFGELVERLEDLSKPTRSEPGIQTDRRSDELRQEVESLKSDFRILASQVGGVPIVRKRVLPPMENIEAHCPNCAAPLAYKQRPREGHPKSVKCPECDAKLISVYADGNFSLKQRVPIAEKLTCPVCSKNVTIEIDPMPGTSVQVDCPECRAHLNAFRRSDGIRIKEMGDQALTKRTEEVRKGLDVELLDRVRNAMPCQPWPKGASREVAAKLDLPYPLVTAAVQELIRQGVFKPQIDGHLYVKGEVGNPLLGEERND